jgi:hypothetical protein
MNIDQTDVGKPDPQMFPLDLIALCAYHGCQQPIHFGDDVINVDGELFCQQSCVIKYIGGRVVQAGIE